ncbi:MAG: hypothetical protein ACJATQ_000599 [Cellvibrionaceae bacterium]
MFDEVASEDFMKLGGDDAAGCTFKKDIFKMAG